MNAYGGLVFAAALSGLVVAVGRIGDGRYETRNGKAARRTPEQAAWVGLAAFSACAVATLLFVILQRMPDKLQIRGVTTADTRTAGASEPGVSGANTTNANAAPQPDANAAATPGRELGKESAK